MKVTYRDHVQKVGLCNKKTKIYQTIKGLIVLFIKLQFSIRCNQAFRPLRTSTSNIYLNLNLNLNGFIICIIPSAFVSSPIYFIIPDVHLQKSLYPIKSGPGLRTYQAWRPLVYPPRGLHHSCHCLDVPEDEVDIRTR